MDLPTLLKEISLLIGIWVAIYGIDSWRRIHKGKRQIELAEDTLALFYEAKDSITYIRHPQSYKSETDDIERAENETDEQYKSRKDASVVFVRYKSHQELFNKIHAMRYRFMAQIGKEEAKPFNDLRRIENEIFGAANVLSRLWSRNHFRTEEQQKKHYKNIEKYEAIFWEGAEEDDPINPRLENLVKEMEHICNAVISGKSTLYSFFNRPIF